MSRCGQLSLRLFLELRGRFDLTILFISHRAAVVPQYPHPDCGDVSRPRGGDRRHRGGVHDAPTSVYTIAAGCGAGGGWPAGDRDFWLEGEPPSQEPAQRLPVSRAAYARRARCRQEDRLCASWTMAGRWRATSRSARTVMAGRGPAIRLHPSSVGCRSSQSDSPVLAANGGLSMREAIASCWFRAGSPHGYHPVALEPDQAVQSITSCDTQAH